MPSPRNPTECGNLMINFEIKFPENNWTSEEQLKKLEAVLGPKPVLPPHSASEVEEVVLHDFDMSHAGQNGRGGGGNAYDEDGDEEGPHGPGGVRCATQ